MKRISIAITLLCLILALCSCGKLDTRSAVEREQDRLEALTESYLAQHPDDIVVYAGRKLRDNQPILGWKDDGTNGATYSSDSYEIGRLPEPLSISGRDLFIVQIDYYNKEPWYEITGESKGKILATAGISDSERLVVNGVNLQIPSFIERELTAKYKSK